MEDIKKLFEEKFKTNNGMNVKSPLRICPLGDHVDHQNGLVTGMALDVSVNMSFGVNDSGFVRVQSLDFPDEEYFHIDDVPGAVPAYWGNYIRGAVLSLNNSYRFKKGINAVISGKLPIGGLSSSAAVTTAYLLALCHANNISITKEDLINHSHWVESEFIGLQNGILDQAANILSRKEQLMFMNCKTREYELVDQSEHMKDYEVLIVYSGFSKALISTDYNNRVDECKVAACILEELAYGKICGLKNVRLSDIDEESYVEYKDKLPGRFRRRAEHYFSENSRVRRGVEYWRSGNIERFGELMFESGESSIHNYECGCDELIDLFYILKKCKGVYGARFSGAGYRGCCIGLVDPRYKEEIKEMIDNEYPKKHPVHADDYRVYFCKTDDGARII